MSLGSIGADHAKETGEMPAARANCKRCDRPALLQRVRAACGEGSEWTDTLQHVLALAGEELQFSVCAFWCLTSDRSAMVCHSTWCSPSENDKLDEFVIFTRNLAFPHGFGLPGRVWESKQSVVLEQINREPNFVRAGVAHAAHLRSAVGAPSIRKGEVLGVLECFDHTPGAASDNTIGCIEDIAAELAQSSTKTD